jgi:hypothetical protein
MNNRYLTFSDTGYIIYTAPHFKGLFISTSDSSLVNALSENTYLPYFHTYNEDFKNFIVKNDTLPKFIKRSEDFNLYVFDVLFQEEINYFRAVITVRIPLPEFRYVLSAAPLKTRYYLKNKATNKIIYLHECIRANSETIDCVGYQLL